VKLSSNRDFTIQNYASNIKFNSLQLILAGEKITSERNSERRKISRKSMLGFAKRRQAQKNIFMSISFLGIWDENNENSFLNFTSQIFREIILAFILFKITNSDFNTSI